MHESAARASIAQSRRSGAAAIVADSFVPTQNELLDYVRLAKSGNEFGREYVVHSMSRLVLDQAAKYMVTWASHLPPHASFDDVFLGGMLGVQIAVERYDPAVLNPKTGEPNAFTSYAVWYIRSEVQRVIYDLAGGGAIRAKAFVRGVAATDPLTGSSVRSLDLADDDRSELNFHAGGADASAEVMDAALVCEVFDLLAAIDPHMPTIARLLDTGFTEREIAREIGMPFSRVRALRERAIAALED